MESINDILEDSLVSDTEKLEKINKVLDTDVEIHAKHISIDKIFGIDSDDIQLKCDVLGKVFKATKDIHENVDLFINSLIQISHKSVAQQSRFFNNLFLFSKKHLQFDCLCLTIEHMNKEALTHDDSILRSREFWMDLTRFLENSQDMKESKKIIYILQTSVKQVKVEDLNFEFLPLPVDDEAWKTFLALVQVCNHDDNSLFKNSLEMLYLINPLPFFWRYQLFKLMLKRSTTDLKCKILTFILNQRYEEVNIQDVSKLVFSALKEIKHHSKECLIHEELEKFCGNLNEEEMQIILDEILNMAWDYDSACLILPSVLIESKSNTIDFDYFYRIVEHFDKLLRSPDKLFNHWPDNVARRVLTFFWDSEDIDKICKIKRSDLYFYCFDLPYSKNVELLAFNKIIELSQANSDDIEEILLYYEMAGGTDVFLKMLKEDKLSIHVRLVTYYRIFNGGGYYTAETQLNQENTVKDFYEYLMKHLNDNTYKTYKELMINFLDLIHRIMGFEFPEDTCKEILKIMHNPELYTKYQVYCAADILKIVYYRFHPYYPYNGDEEKYYKEVAEVWKKLILESDDLEIASEGIYYVLAKGELDTKEYTEVIKKLLEKHTCDRVTELIYENGYYSGYLNKDVIPLAFEHLSVIKEKCPSKYEEFSTPFCVGFVDTYDSLNDDFSEENEYWKFCLSNKHNFRTTLKKLADDIIDNCKFYDLKIHGIILDLYLNDLCGVEDKLICLDAFTRLLERISWTFRVHPKSKEYKMKINFNSIISLFKDYYVINFENNISRLRIVQALTLFVQYSVPYIKLHPKDLRYKLYQETCRKLAKKLKRIAVGMLVKESSFENNAVKQTCQYMYILLSKDNITFDEIRCIMEKIKERPDLVTSFIPVLYHVLPFSNLSSSEVEELFSLACSLSTSSNIKERRYVQLLLQRLLVKNNEIDLKKDLVKCDKVQTELVEIDRKQCEEALGADYLFLDVLDPIRDHTLETILYTLPKLNQVDPSEWWDITEYHSGFYQIRIKRFTKDNDKNETIHKAVDEFLERQRSSKVKNVHYTVADILRMFPIPSQNPVIEQLQRRIENFEKYSEP